MTRMLERAIEIEGLIRILRDGTPSDETYALLKRKTAELSDEAALLYIKASEERKKSDPMPSAPLKDETADPVITNQPAETEEETDDIILTLEDDDREEVFREPEQARPTAKLKSMFSLNDRFLYSRELFGGNMKMFDSTLEFIEGVKDFADIEDYFYSELEWDPENRFVESFLETIRPYY